MLTIHRKAVRAIAATGRADHLALSNCNRSHAMTSPNRRAILAGIAFAALGPAAASAREGVYTSRFSDVAASGYDVVAYFTDRRPVEGSREFTAGHDGATWRFASAANRDAFEADPSRYAPQYGGYCAWAVSQGYTASTVPEAWKIVDDKLYLNYSKGVQARWETDIPGHIAKADTNWPEVLE